MNHQRYTRQVSNDISYVFSSVINLSRINLLSFDCWFASTKEPRYFLEDPAGKFLKSFSTPLSRFRMFLSELFESASLELPLHRSFFRFCIEKVDDQGAHQVGIGSSGRLAETAEAPPSPASTKTVVEGV